MRQLLPDVIDGVDPVELNAADARPPHPDRPWVIVNMIASVDGATAVEDRSGGLGGPPDRAVFRALRGLPDVILVGAATVRTEGYGPVRLDEDARRRRIDRGVAAVPRLAVVSGSLDLDPDAAMFTESDPAPLVLTCEGADPERRRRLDRVAEVHAVGGQRVSMRSALELLGRLGATTVLCEGGPTVNAQLLAEDLVDEWCQTISPMLVGGTSSRAAVGPGAATTDRDGTSRIGPLDMVLARLLEQDGMLLARYLRRR